MKLIILLLTLYSSTSYAVTSCAINNGTCDGQICYVNGSSQPGYECSQYVSPSTGILVPNCNSGLLCSNAELCYYGGTNELLPIVQCTSSVTGTVQVGNLDGTNNILSGLNQKLEEMRIQDYEQLGNITQINTSTSRAATGQDSLNYNLHCQQASNRSGTTTYSEDPDCVAAKNAEIDAKKQAADNVETDNNGTIIDYVGTGLDALNVGTTISQLLPLPTSTTCSGSIHETFNIAYLGTKTFDISPCEKLAPLRAVLYWVFYVLTLFQSVRIFTRGT